MKTIRRAILSLAIAAVLLELAARIATTIKDDFIDADVAWYVYSASVGWGNRPNYKGRLACGNDGEFDASGLRSVDSSQLADATRKTVIFLGDSNTFGYCAEEEETFVEGVDRLLPDANAINLGVNGYSSYQGYRALLERGQALEPDVIVASFNFNDRRYVRDESAVDGEAWFERTARTELLDTLRTSHLVRALLSLISFVQPPEPSQVDLRTLRPRVDLPSYRRNLGNIAQWARRHDAGVLFVLLGDNPESTATLRRGVEKLERGEVDRAIAELTRAVEDRWFGDLARIHLAQAYTQAGMPEKAGQVALVKPFGSLHGGYPILLDTQYHDAMREVAAEYGVDVVDARRELDREPRDYIDFGHFDRHGHAKVARLLHERIAALMRDSGQGSRSPSP